MKGPHVATGVTCAPFLFDKNISRINNPAPTQIAMSATLNVG